MKNTFLIITMLTILAACNTIEGVGKDVEGAGNALSKTATKTKEKIK